MMLVQVVIVGLAAWRASAFLVYEEGPAGIFRRFRTAIGIRPDGGEIVGILPLLFTCIWCTSAWMAAIMWALWYIHWAIPGVLAAAAVAIAMERASSQP